MTPPVTEVKEYAKVVDGKIVEKGLTESEILARGDVLADFLEVKVQTQPDISSNIYKSAEPMYFFHNGEVLKNWRIRDLTFGETLAIFYKDKPEGTLLYAKDVPEYYWRRIVRLVDNYLVNQLNEFASERKYESIDRLIGFCYSRHAHVAAEANYANNLRDDALEKYWAWVDGIEKNTVPMPKNREEILAMFGPINWSNCTVQETK